MADHVNAKVAAPLDYAAIIAGTAAIAGEFAAMLAPAGHEKCLTAPDDVIRHECELLAAWEHSRTGATFMDKPEYRKQMLTFVLDQRDVTEWPSWGDAWVKGGEE